MKVDLNERVALVTGGANGIGRAIVQLLADNGACVVILDLEEATAEAVAREVREAGGQCAAVQGDVTDAAGMEAAAREVAERFGAIHILVNNAGINRISPIDEVRDADWDEVLAVNLTAPMIAQGLPAKGWSGGREAQSIAFFKTPVIE